MANVHIMRYEEIQDQLLIDKARSGDQEAFNELFIRHRDQAFQYARYIAKDSHLAEDIVQEALINAFLHLGKLSHSGFVPWLQRIVRNQAMMKLRRGGPYAKERPFSSYEAGPLPETKVDLSDIDSILHHLSRTYTDQEQERNNPANIMLRRDILDTIRQMLQALSKRERQIFEAHFFHQLSPDEIASLFDTTTANIYKALSRSKQKLELEKYVFDLRDSLRHRLERRGFKTNTLSKPAVKGSSYPHPDLTFPNCLYHALQYTDLKDMSFTALMGLTNYAFKINMYKKKVSMNSMHDWNTFKSNGLVNLGFHCSYMDIYGFGTKQSPQKSDLIWQAVQMICDSVDKGRPAFVWDLMNPEFALVYGYDDEKQLFYAMDTKADQSVGYSMLGHRRTNHLYLIVMEDPFELDLDSQLRRLFHLIIRHARGNEPIFYSHVNGLAAYETWIHLLLQGQADELGHAANVKIVGEARAAAAEFLHIVAGTWREKDGLKPVFVHHLTQAASCYRIVADCFRELQIKIPYPAGACLDASSCSDAVHLLRNAWSAEEQGVRHLEELVDLFDREKVGERYPALIGPSPFFRF